MSQLAKQEHKLKSDEIEVEEKLKNFASAIIECKSHIHQWKAKVKLLVFFANIFFYFIFEILPTQKMLIHTIVQILITFFAF